MATTAELTIRLEALKKARDTGSLQVRHGDTSVTYRSLAEITDIIAAIEKEIAEAAGAVRRVRYIRQRGRG